MRQQDELGPIGIAVRKELGIIGQDGTSISEKQLTPLAELPDAIFEQRDTLSFLTGADKEEEGLDPHAIKLARLAMKLYGQIQEESRARRGMENYGATKVVGKVGISPFGSEKRSIVDFTTTNCYGENDWEINVSSLLFDLHIEPKELGDPQRKDHLIVGEKDQELQVIGRHEDLFEAHGRGLIKTLEDQGYEKIGELWVLYIDRYGGMFKPPQVS